MVCFKSYLVSNFGTYLLRKHTSEGGTINSLSTGGCVITWVQKFSRPTWRRSGQVLWIHRKLQLAKKLQKEVNKSRLPKCQLCTNLLSKEVFSKYIRTFRRLSFIYPNIDCTSSSFRALLIPWNWGAGFGGATQDQAAGSCWETPILGTVQY